MLSLEESSYPKYLRLGSELVHEEVGGGGYLGFSVVLRYFFCHLPEAQDCILPQQHPGMEGDPSVWDGCGQPQLGSTGQVRCAIRALESPLVLGIWSPSQPPLAGAASSSIYFLALC